VSGLGRAFAAAQYAYDNRAESEDDEDALTEDDARELAESEIMATPAVFAGALEALSDPAWSANSAQRDVPGRYVHDVQALCGGMPRNEVVDTTNLQSHELTAILASGEDRHALAALKELRERIARHLKDEINARAAELLREQERFFERLSETN
jgi:hypothetical protein